MTDITARPGVKSRQRVYIFGASAAGKQALQYLSNQIDLQLLGWLDNDPKKHGNMLEGLPIHSPAILKSDQSYDKIIIASMYHPQIRKQLKEEFGLPEHKYENIPIHVAKGNIDLRNEQRYQLAHELLFAVSQILIDYDVPFYVDHGTLLGIYRDKQLMPWDNDIDFAIQSESMEQAWQVLQQQIPKMRLKICPDCAWTIEQKEGDIDFSNHIETLPRIFKVKSNTQHELTENFMLDLIIKYPYQDKYYWLVGTTTLSAPCVQTSQTARFLYQGVKLPIPIQTEQYLTTLYQDWKTPVKLWDHSKYSNIN